MAGDLRVYLFGGEAVRVVELEGETSFVGRDVCERLGYADPTNAMKQHCKGVAKYHPLQTAGGVQELRIISLADMLRLIVNSKLSAAVEFERWVFEDLLPEIHRKGYYDPDEERREERRLRRTGGVTKAVVHKAVHEILPRLVAAEVAKGVMIAQAGWVYALDLAIEAGAVQRKRRGLVNAIGNRLDARLDLSDRHVDARGKRIFRKNAARQFMAAEGGRMVAEHNNRWGSRGPLFDDDGVA